MQTLHVAALPFPTQQGTQAAIRSMMEALDSKGALVIYADGEDEPVPFRVERGAKLFGRSALRSGPSLRKLAENIALAPAVRRQWATRSFGAVFGHHVEAAALTLAMGIRPVVFVAHTRLEPELPLYFDRGPRRLVSALGRWTDRALCSQATLVAAISPRLCRELARATGRAVSYLPIPWRLFGPITLAERYDARERLDLHNREVLLYAGNLDAYQGWQDIVVALVRLRRKRSNATLLVATASDPRPVREAAMAAGVAEHVRVHALGGEESRRLLHAAADVVVITRRTDGGIPVKLLDALGRGVPTITTMRATAELPLDGATIVARNDEPDALVHVAQILLEDIGLRRDLERRGPEYIAAEHSKDRFRHAIDQIGAEARAMNKLGRSRGKQLNRSSSTIL